MTAEKKERLYWLKASRDYFKASRSINPRKRHHIFAGYATILAVAAFLTFSGKARKVQADSKTVFEIAAPRVTSQLPVVELPELTNMAALSATIAPFAEIVEKNPVSVAVNDGMPILANLPNRTIIAGIYKRPQVQLTKELAKLAQDISAYFGTNNMQALITSGVRTSKGQLELIKDRVAERGMMNNFPGLASASIKDTALWQGAWEWLKARRVQINPPADYVNDDGKQVGGSLHLKGLALDLIADDLGALKQGLEAYMNSPEHQRRRGLKITGIVREPDCVHISLSK